MSTIGYAAEKLWEAVHKLALGAGRINERLEQAAPHVAMAAGAHDNMQAELRAEYDSTWARLTAVAPEANQGAVHATIRQMSEDDACDIASQVLTLAYKAKEASEQERSGDRRQRG